MYFCKKIAIVFLGLVLSIASIAQVKFSLSTDFSVERSFKKEQQYWAVGQTITAHFHFTPTDGLYAWLVYYSQGKFSNDLTATAKSVLTSPQSINYRNNAALDFRQVSLGWKHYFKGAADIEKGMNLYGYAGFGLMLGNVINSHSVLIDTANYNLPVLAGEANFKRLTVDLGLGAEWALGGNLYFYLESRVFVPASDYPSKYIFINNNAPLAGSGNIGFRILVN